MICLLWEWEQIGKGSPLCRLEIIDLVICLFLEAGYINHPQITPRDSCSGFLPEDLAALGVTHSDWKGFRTLPDIVPGCVL